MSSDESESSLEDWLDESSFQCLRRFFFFVHFLFLALESDDDKSDKSDDEGSGSRFTSGSCFLLSFELSTDRVISFSSSRIVSSRVRIFSIIQFDVSRSNNSLVSNSESLIYLRYANFLLIVSISPCVGAVLMSLSVGL